MSNSLRDPIWNPEPGDIVRRHDGVYALVDFANPLQLGFVRSDGTAGGVEYRNQWSKIECSAGFPKQAVVCRQAEEGWPWEGNSPSLEDSRAFLRDWMAKRSEIMEFPSKPADSPAHTRSCTRDDPLAVRYVCTGCGHTKYARVPRGAWPLQSPHNGCPKGGELSPFTTDDGKHQVAPHTGRILVSAEDEDGICRCSVCEALVLEKR